MRPQGILTIDIYADTFVRGGSGRCATRPRRRKGLITSSDRRKPSPVLLSCPLPSGDTFPSCVVQKGKSRRKGQRQGTRGKREKDKVDDQKENDKSESREDLITEGGDYNVPS